MIQDVNPAKEYLIVKLKRLEGVSFTDYHRFGIRIAKSVFGIRLTCVLYSVQLEVTLFTCTSWF